ncbi:MAG: permease [Cyclobacteriaceae bacterium]|nr:permease [Cyclobacteriaceae bacterium]
MSDAITKTVSLLLLIFVGVLISGKIKGKEQREGVRTIILSLALPATIFIALLKVDFTLELMLVPVLALAFNFIMYFLISKLPLDSLFSIQQNQYRTLMLIIPSLAPGLSVFPFILEYSGESTLAMAAVADLGNKVFVLIIAYIIAMRWYYKLNREFTGDGKVNLKDVLKALVNEPVNLVVVTAILLLSSGISYQSFPGFLKGSIDKLSLMMTPLVLLFIGMSVKFTWAQVRTIMVFLFFRSGVAFLISALLLFMLEPANLGTALLIVVFPQSACSFWPFAHMAAVNKLETGHGKASATFDTDFAMNILACSLPFSVILVMLIYLTQGTFTSALNVSGAGAVFLLLAAGPALVPVFIPGSSAERPSLTQE